jgi:cobalt/nickel transport system permease protein
MHLPDGFLSLPVAAGAAAVSAGAVGIALKKCRTELDDRAEPLLGVTAAAIFAGQMVNFPIPGGTSGHLLGGVLAGIVLGPWAGLVAMTCVLIVQCFLFADGGLVALGANVLNMAVVGCLAGSAIFALFKPLAKTPTQTAVAAGIAAWCATLLSSAACALELSASGNFGLPRTFGLMVGVHSVIGIGEALITGLVVAALHRRRSLVARPNNSPSVAEKPSPTPMIFGVLALAATVVVVLAPFASAMPDGLERVLGWMAAKEPEAAAPLPSPFPDYQIAGWNEHLGTVLTGLIGLSAAMILGWILAKVRFPTPKPDPAAS